nr:unnamed protein product [Spirometra erinaceieuropaei]
MFRAPVALIGHHRTSHSTRTTPPDVSPSISASCRTLTIDTDHSHEPPLPSSSVASASATTAPAPTVTALNPNTPTNINLIIATSSDVDLVHIPVLIATTPSPRTSAWSVTYESISRRLANQCLENQHTPGASASAALTESAHSLTA